MASIWAVLDGGSMSWIQAAAEAPIEMNGARVTGQVGCYLSQFLAAVGD